jgi:hypothetical protein
MKVQETGSAQWASYFNKKLAQLQQFGHRALMWRAATYRRRSSCSMACTTVATSLRMSVSQKRSTVHPASRNAPSCSRSRSTFRRIFATQYGALWPLSSLARRFSRSRPCQKSPSQKTATLAIVNTTSGLPGRFGAVMRYRNPACQSAFRRCSSQRVFCLRLEARALTEARTDEGVSPLKRGVFEGAIAGNHSAAASPRAIAPYPIPVPGCASCSPASRLNGLGTGPTGSGGGIRFCASGNS